MRFIFHEYELDNCVPLLSAAAAGQGGEMNNERPDSPSGRFLYSMSAGIRHTMSK